MSVPTLVTTLLFVVLVTVATAATAPCHSNRRSSGNNVDCEVPVIPPALCRACKLRPTLRKGNFQSCSRIYDLTTADCRKQLRRYARLNPCDKVRNDQVKDFSKDINVVGLDYFIYAVCEQCCDCVPRGTNEGEFDTRLAAGTLIKVDRANCATHANFDVCKVLPEVRYVKRYPKQATPANLEDKYPKICPTIRKWKAGPDGQKTFNKDEVNMPDTMRAFLTQYTDSMKCKSRTLWNECVELETAQRRI